MQGLLEGENWPEFNDEEFVEEVRGRLAGVGYELCAADGYWLARCHDEEAIEGVKALFPLDEAEHAILAALYLYLRFLPRQSHPNRNGERPSVTPEEIDRAFPAYKPQAIRRILGRLRNLHFVRQYANRIYPGPYLMLLDETVADERARQALRDFKLRTDLRERLVALKEEFDASN